MAPADAFMNDERFGGTMPTVYFVCEGNRFRSQMAEGFFRAWAPPGWDGVSGGTDPKTEVH
ncbi:MAG: hypothetical protein HY557_08610, partial [Euryarchaeota archaeon]|nr:hypothetical protein [Euryarchaeota archaeon]